MYSYETRSKPRVYGRYLISESEELSRMEKALADERNKFEKQKAILQQQIELLTLSLAEASDREKTIKKNHETMFHALNNRNSVLENATTRKTEPSPHKPVGPLFPTPEKGTTNRNTFQEMATSPFRAMADQSVDIQSSILYCDKIEELKKDMEDLNIVHRKEVQGLEQ